MAAFRISPSGLTDAAAPSARSSAGSICAMGISLIRRRPRARSTMRHELTATRWSHASKRSTSRSRGSCRQAATNAICAASAASASSPRIARPSLYIASIRLRTSDSKATASPSRARSTSERPASASFTVSLPAMRSVVSHSLDAARPTQVHAVANERGGPQDHTDTDLAPAGEIRERGRDGAARLFLLLFEQALLEPALQHCVDGHGSKDNRAVDECGVVAGQSDRDDPGLDAPDHEGAEQSAVDGATATEDRG